LPYLQVYWIPSAHLKPGASTSVGRSTVHGRARGPAALLRWGFTAKPF
jgi:tRNA (cmo5U34)-methyltransferase